MLVLQFEVRAPAGSCISHLAASDQDAHLIAATTDGHVHLIDPRAAGGSAASLQPHSAPLVTPVCISISCCLVAFLTLQYFRYSACAARWWMGSGVRVWNNEYGTIYDNLHVVCTGTAGWMQALASRHAGIIYGSCQCVSILTAQWQRCSCTLQVDIALEPGMQPHLLVTGCARDNALKLTDLRMLSSQHQGQSQSSAESGRSAVWKTVATDLRGRLTALTAHACAPLIAAGSSHQVKSAWCQNLWPLPFKSCLLGPISSFCCTCSKGACIVDAAM